MWSCWLIPEENSNNCLVCCKLDSQYLSIEFNLQNVCEVIWIFAFVCKHNRIRDKACEKHAQILEWSIYGSVDELSLCESLKDKLVVQNLLIISKEWNWKKENMKKSRREVFRAAVHRVRPFSIGFDFVPGDDVSKGEMLEVKVLFDRIPRAVIS